MISSEGSEGPDAPDPTRREWQALIDQNHQLEQQLGDIGAWVAGVTGRLPAPGTPLVDAVREAAAKYQPSPPKVGETVTNSRVYDCIPGTILRLTHAAGSAVRTINGWSATGIPSTHVERFMEINTWVVLYVPAPRVNR